MKTKIMVSLPMEFQVAVMYKTKSKDEEDRGLTIHYQEDKVIKMGHLDFTKSLWYCIDEELTKMIKIAFKNKDKWVVNLDEKNSN